VSDPSPQIPQPHPGRIPTPWRTHWRRLRQQAIPVVTLGLAVLATSWLWRRHYQPMEGVGVVRTLEAQATSQRDGLLVEPPGGYLQLHDRVARGQVVARLDDRPLLAALKVLQAEVSRLQLELPARQESTRIDLLGLEQRQAEETRRLAVQVEDLELTILQLQAQLDADRVELARQQALFDMNERLAATGAASQRELLEAGLRRDVVAERVTGGTRALAEAQRQLAAARDRLARQPAAPTIEVDALLAPVRAQIDAQRARLEELGLQLQAVNIASPLDGRVTAIHRYPGQSVRAGEPILSIAHENGQQVICYVRPEQRVTPAVGMAVEIRTRDGSRKIVESSVRSIGPAIEPVPVQHLHDPRVPEWGLPVLIELPDGPLRPGELVSVRFQGL
jgi:multidrug resistance efflux pump